MSAEIPLEANSQYRQELRNQCHLRILLSCEKEKLFTQVHYDVDHLGVNEHRKMLHAL